MKRWKIVVRACLEVLKSRFFRIFCKDGLQSVPLSVYECAGIIKQIKWNTLLPPYSIMVIDADNNIW